MAANTITANPMQVGGDPLDITTSDINARAYREFQLRNVFVQTGSIVDYFALPNGVISRDFVLEGDALNTGGAHTRGNFIEGGTIVQAKKNIGFERPEIQALKLDNFDGDVATHPQIQRYVSETSRVNTEKLNSRLAIVALNGARQSSVANVHDGGHIVTRVAADIPTAYPFTSTGANNLEDDIASMAQKFSERNIDEMGRILFIRPREMRVLMNSTRVVNRDYVQDPTLGNISDHVVTRLHGFSLIQTNYLPSTNITTDLSKYNGNFTTAVRQPIAIAMHVGGGAAPLGLVSPSSMMLAKVFEDDNRYARVVQHIMTYGCDWITPWKLGEIGVSVS